MIAKTLALFLILICVHLRDLRLISFLQLLPLEVLGVLRLLHYFNGGLSKRGAELEFASSQVVMKAVRATFSIFR